MDAASAAISNFLSGSGQKHSTDSTSTTTKTEHKEEHQQVKAPEVVSDTAATTTGEKDTTIEQEVAPAVQHETVKREHETREQTVIDRERHQDHYHTTIQPLQDREVEPEKHDSKVVATEERKINKDEEGDKVKAKVAAEQAAFKNTTEEQKTKQTKVKEDTIEGETVHHHYHETIQPVIEKERIVKEVTHKVKPVHEVVQEKTVNHGVDVVAPISVDAFEHRLSGEKKADVPVETGVTSKKD